eukprot:967156-Pleurochrysis_carterae.AAC.1
MCVSASAHTIGRAKHHDEASFTRQTHSIAFVTKWNLRMKTMLQMKRDLRRRRKIAKIGMKQRRQSKQGKRGSQT